MKGSLTVEAAWIFPFCFFVIGLVCCLGIYEYDKAVMKMTGYECILEFADSLGTEKDNVQVFSKHLIEQAQARTLSLESLTVETKMTNTKISVTYSGVQTLLNIPVEVTVVYERSFPELTLRLKKDWSK